MVCVLEFLLGLYGSELPFNSFFSFLPVEKLTFQRRFWIVFVVLLFQYSCCEMWHVISPLLSGYDILCRKCMNSFSVWCTIVHLQYFDIASRDTQSWVTALERGSNASIFDGSYQQYFSKYFSCSAKFQVYRLNVSYTQNFGPTLLGYNDWRLEGLNWNF